uniref:Uncharacterized protein n=1 Tax=Grammatophora oceanica TaxID=210454 RepID=A0A7S1YJ97_9STRA|mmetsp:Transcript_4967/g.6921  ORF Transcript_4967/g.6921 Transcript_4967/m.6921 type:complete len:116 (+) Transcript_4967:313-660(+)
MQQLEQIKKWNIFFCSPPKSRSKKSRRNKPRVPPPTQRLPPNNNSQLSADEKKTFLQLYLLIDGVKCHHNYKPLRDFAFAVPFSLQSVRNWKRARRRRLELTLKIRQGTDSFQLR